jgi:hypothetical protein
MEPIKTKYLDRLRRQTSYGEMRGFAELSRSFGRVSGLLFVILGFLAFCGGFVTGSRDGTYYIVNGLTGMLMGAILTLLGSLIRYAVNALADIADSIADLNCRYEQADQPIKNSDE